VLNNSGKYSEDLSYWLMDLKEHVITTNNVWAEKLRINPATATTCGKPSGTVSQLVDCASGIHPRYSEFYIRTVRNDKKDPLYNLMKDSGVYCEDDLMKPDTTSVFHFPMKAPEGSVFRDDRSAIEQLELWKIYQLYWCEHKPLT
jgi:ribonucleoside-triphosphate reductase